ncbi:MAG TPA: serine hydrolase [Thermoleophilia bacterium]|nr:serine hydrolase [Thermoleophilia bacterium]
MTTEEVSAAPQSITLANWQLPPFNRWAFQRVRQFVPSARVDRGEGPLLELPSDPRNLDGVRVPLQSGARTTLAAFLGRSCTDGFIALRHGRIAAERYDNGMTARTPHLLESVSKSLCGAIAGVLAGEGALETDAPVAAYVPELDGTSFDGATVRHLLDMTTGTLFSEEYEDPDSDVRAVERAAGWAPASRNEHDAGVLPLMRGLANSRAHGERFEYRSVLTDVLALVLERAGGARFAEVMSRRLWAPLGVENDAEITVDRMGAPIADGGISVTLRDLARVGQLYAQSGCVDGRQVVPAAWVQDTRVATSQCRSLFHASPQSSEALCSPAEQACQPLGHYRNQWWVLEPDRGVLLAAGIYGQYLYVDMTADVVIAKMSSLPEPLDIEVSADTLAAFSAVVAALG